MTNNCTTAKLIEAIMLIQALNQANVITAIQFEDGSGNNFNYQVNGGKWLFIDMKTIRTLLETQACVL